MKAIHVDKTASRGIVIGKALLIEKPKLTKNLGTIQEQDIEEEIKRYDNALSASISELEQLAEKDLIFAAHLEMVKDFTFYDGVIAKIKDFKKNAEAAVEETSEEFIQVFEAIEDEYMRERASDIKDIRYRLISKLQGVNNNELENIKEEVILIAQDLTPSDTACLNLEYILGFITQEGGVTSHVSIMAKGLGIPALVGVQGILDFIKTDDMIIMDAGKGEIIINPDEETLLNYQELKKEHKEKQSELAKINHLPSVTKDGRQVRLCVNVGSIKDIQKAMEFRTDGVGLFRSEFLYMDNSHFPTEEEQFEVYKEAAVRLCGKELTIRTLDIGGDKALSYYEFEKEENPFLGWRAIRISLELKEMFKTQIRAILRASAFGILRIMFPMIISMEELRLSKEILEECKKELRNENIACDQNIEVGMMIETPASVILAEDFAREVNFFSIGTNDLTQYLLAVDRGNKKVSKLYNSFHPSVIRSIRTIIAAGHKHQITVGMCGEFASDERAIKLLLGLGLDEFSMSALEIIPAKSILRDTCYTDAVLLAEKVCEMQTIQEVYEILNIGE